MKIVTAKTTKNLLTDKRKEHEENNSLISLRKTSCSLRLIICFND